MSTTKPSTTDTRVTLDAPIAVIWIPHVDFGDAGGMGNSTKRTIVPGTPHETAEDVRARGGMWGPA